MVRASSHLSIFLSCSHPSLLGVGSRVAQIMPGNVLGVSTLSTASGGRFHHPSHCTSEKSKEEELGLPHAAEHQDLHTHETT